MECNKIESLLEKYFQGETNIAEEQELKDYFSSQHVLPHLEQYKSLFDYFADAKEQKLSQGVMPKTKKRNLAWLSVAASVVVLLGIGTFAYLNKEKATQDLGTFDNPEVAFVATQKALALLSNHVNVGIESVQYIQEYQNSKDLIFKQQ
jgi:hypothetical protein